MIRTDKPIYKVILILNIIFIAIGIITSIIGFKSATSNEVIIKVINLLAWVFALIYILHGYRKNAAVYYKVFGWGYLITHLAFLASLVTAKDSPVIFYFTCGISIIILLTLLLKLNLGKKISLILCAILVLMKVIILICMWISTKDFSALSTRLIDLDFACLLGILTYAKYLDKDERGTR